MALRRAPATQAFRQLMRARAVGAGTIGIVLDLLFGFLTEDGASLTTEGDVRLILE